MSDIPTATQSDETAQQDRQANNKPNQGAADIWNLYSPDKQNGQSAQQEGPESQAGQQGSNANGDNSDKGQVIEKQAQAGSKNKDSDNRDVAGLQKASDGQQRREDRSQGSVNGSASFDAVLQRFIDAAPADGAKKSGSTRQQGNTFDQFAAARYKGDKMQSLDRRRPQLSPKEISERKRVSDDAGGVGFGFDKDKPSLDQLKRWYSQLTDKQKKALQNPNATVTISATCSRPGSESYNKTLSERRAKNTAKALRDQMGVKAKIFAFGFGETFAKEQKHPNHVDLHQDRYAIIHIEAGSSGKKGEKKHIPPADKSSPGKVDKAAREIGKRGSPPDAPTKYTTEQGIKDWLKNPVTSPDKLAQKLIKEYIKQIGNAYKNQIDSVKQGVRSRAIISSLNLIAIDAKNAKSPHVKDGKPYSATELSSRDWLQKKQAMGDAFSKVNNSNAAKVYDLALKEVADKINPLLKQAKTPADRRQTMQRFSAIAFSVIKDAIRRQRSDTRRKWGRRR